MNKGLVIGAVVVLLIIVVAGGYLLTMGSGAPAATTTTVAQPSTTAFTTVGVPQTNLTSTNYTVSIANNATYGAYLVNASGYTLYTYNADVPYSGESSCRDSCKNVWPPFYTAEIAPGSGLSASEFNVINSTGTAVPYQLTYKGWPLYRYVQDTRPGMISGNGIAGFQVATP